MIFKGIKKMTKFMRDEKGASIIEFALVGIVVFGLLFAIVDLGMMFYVNLTMQNAVREGARFAVTGNSSDPDLQNSVIQKVKEKSVGLCDKNPCTFAFFVVHGADDREFRAGEPSNEAQAREQQADK